MKKITERLKRDRVLVSDGAWGTLLQERGLAPGECPEHWNLTHREAVFGIASSYAESGASLIKTNSFGSNRMKLTHYGLQEQTEAINKSAAAISREAAGSDRIVIASVGPTGRMIMTGDTNEDELVAVFAEQIGALGQGGADAVCIETMSALDEACCAIRAAHESTDLEVICTFTFEKTLQGEYRTMMGVSPEDMAIALRDAGADVIGANCGNGIEQMIAITERIRSVVSDLPILVHANAGLPVERNGRIIFPETPSDMASGAPGLITAGASIIGGCCGTTPAHIRAIVEAVKNLPRKPEHNHD